MENIFIHPDAMRAITDQIFKPLLNGDQAKAQKLVEALVPTCIADLHAPFNYKLLQPLTDEISRLKHLPAALLVYCSHFTPPLALSRHTLDLINCLAAWRDKNVRYCKNKKLESAYKEIFKILWPHSANGLSKIRLGGERDGGYVCMEPNSEGIAYSFGVSPHSPWDLEMAEKGFKVYQFDGTINNPPDTHPNLRFIPKNIVASNSPKAHEKNIDQIFSDLGHESQMDIILQIDIEGGEWDFFEKIATPHIQRFSQIIAEFHKLHDEAHLPRAKAIFEKICQTHVPVHFHYNNNTQLLVFSDFLVSSLFEITFVRRNSCDFEKSDEIYPTLLDKPNVGSNPEIYIGSFHDIAK